MLIVHDSYKLAAQNPTPNEEAEVSKIWAQYLWSSVPADDLVTSFERAFADHASTFPVTTQEIKVAYSKIAKERKQAEYAERAASGDSLREPECPVCFSSGFERVRRCSPEGRWYEAVNKITTCCNYWTKRLSEIVEPHKL